MRAAPALTFAAVLAFASAAAAVLLWPRIHARFAGRADDEQAAGPREPEGAAGEHGATGSVATSAALATSDPKEGAAPAAGPGGAVPARAEALPAYATTNPESATACPEGMVLIDGVYCPFVGHRCTEYLIEERDVCKTFAPEVICEGQLQQRRFCIDLYEYPNMEGVRPAIMADWNDAVRACKVEGKRLCTTDEWQFACEGTVMWPYPYGIERDPSACNIDRPYPFPDLRAFSDRWKISEEVGRLDQRVPSGAMPRCVSPFGVYDMTGNVDEWVVYPNGKRDDKPYRSSLKGGYWGPIRARCRPMTSTHNEWFSFYQVGFRCCAGAKPPPDKAKARPLPKGSGLRRLELPKAQGAR